VEWQRSSGMMWRSSVHESCEARGCLALDPDGPHHMDLQDAIYRCGVLRQAYQEAPLV
jgi:hypothetical protein